MRVAGRGYTDGVRNLEGMVESLSGGSRPEIQEEGRVIELKKFCLSILSGQSKVLARFGGGAPRESYVYDVVALVL